MCATCALTLTPAPTLALTLTPTPTPAPALPHARRCGPAGDAPECKFPASLSAGNDTAAVRLLDPLVLSAITSGANVSIPAGLPAAVAALWQATDAATAPRAELGPAWDGLRAVAFPALAVEPLFRGACASEECAGVMVGTGHCLCPQ